jgi:hypothetical protein
VNRWCRAINHKTMYMYRSVNDHEKYPGVIVGIPQAEAVARGLRPGTGD